MSEEAASPSGRGVTPAVAGAALLVLASLAALFVIRDVVGSSAQRMEDVALERRNVRDQVVATIDSHLEGVLTTARAIAKSPRLVALLTKESESRFGPAELGAVAEIDRQWRNGTIDNATAKLVAQSDVSAFLREFVGGDRPLFREVFASDRYGRLVGMSNMTEDYDQGDADDGWWWPARNRTQFDDGCARGEPSCIRIFDVDADRSAGRRCWFIVLPIVDRDRPVVQGVLKVAVDVAGLDGLEKLAQVGRRFEVRLVNARGQSLADPQVPAVAEVPDITPIPAPGQEWEVRETREYIRAVGQPVFSRAERGRSSSWLVVVRDPAGAAPAWVQRYLPISLLSLCFVAATLFLAGAIVAFSRSSRVPDRMRRFLYPQ